NWYTVTAVRQLAEHARRSLAAGDRVILTGTLRLLARPGGERGGVTVEVDAVSIGHDLRWQEARSLRRAPGQAPSDAAQPVPPPRHLPRTQPSQATPGEPDVQPAAVSRA
ncbi:single-stranded DNA-binding protein, partial [Leucobacter sp. M11]|uniref:single-stranded DNA-binding protein n=1 Tax=Leucobacter sp. M11 TaxID=2993565 RepID=UPI002D905B4C|nr:hypothetical protein [Leucobacter sp. M11]